MSGWLATPMARYREERTREKVQSFAFDLIRFLNIYPLIISPTYIHWINSPFVILFNSFKNIRPA